MRRNCRPQTIATGLTTLLFIIFSGILGQAQEPEELEMDTLNVADTLYHLAGGGGNALALIDEINGGIILIDAKLPGWGERVMETVEGVTDLPVTTVIVTHGHIDHAGGYSEYPEAIQVLAHENTKRHMDELVQDTSASTVRITTFTDSFSLLEDLDRIELYYFGAAHTDGDTVVVFPQKGTAYLGDLFPAKAAPVIDTERGGSGIAFPDTLARIVAEIQGVTRVITGHGPFPDSYAGRGRNEPIRMLTGFLTWEDLSEYADFNREFLESVQNAFRAGKNVDEAMESLQLPDRFQDYDMENANANIEAIYGELAAQ